MTVVSLFSKFRIGCLLRQRKIVGCCYCSVVAPRPTKIFCKSIHPVSSSGRRLIFLSYPATAVATEDTEAHLPSASGTDYYEHLVHAPKGFSNVKSLEEMVILLEGAAKHRDVKRAALLCHFRWKDLTTITFDDFDDLSRTSYDYYVRAVNAIVQLQALSYMDLKSPFLENSCQPLSDWQKSNFTAKIYKQFFSMQLYKFALEKCIVPNSDTIMWSLVLRCFSYNRELMLAFCRLLIYRGGEFRTDCFTKWVHHCRQAKPYDLKWAIADVRRMLRGFNIKLSLDDLRELLSLRCLKWHGVNEEKFYQATHEVDQSIRYLMQDQGFLETLEGWKLLMSRYVHLRKITLVTRTFENMAERGIDPDLELLQITVEGLIDMNTYDANVMASFYCWRELIRHYPLLKPDIAFMNKMLYCCRKLEDADRAFYFVAVMHHCKITPTVDTFEILLNICHECNEKNLFNKTLRVALRVLPSGKLSIYNTAAKIVSKWKVNIDTEMAYTVITGKKERVELLDITGNEAGIMSDLQNQDTDAIKNIISRYSSKQSVQGGSSCDTRDPVPNVHNDYHLEGGES